MKQQLLFVNNQKFTSLRHADDLLSDTLYICSKRTIIKDTELEIEIDLKDKVNQFNKIIIDGITFVKETKSGFPRDKKGRFTKR